ncbi:hypothetical protein RyT2_11690 [Pseudolactococcus yaeyamensis]
MDETSEYFVDKLGLDVYRELLVDFGGSSVYFPKLESFEREKRNEKIFSEFDGSNYRLLAQRYGLSESYVRALISEQYGRLSGNLADGQMTIFDFLEDGKES